MSKPDVTAAYLPKFFVRETIEYEVYAATEFDAENAWQKARAAGEEKLFDHTQVELRIEVEAQPEKQIYPNCQGFGMHERCAGSTHWYGEVTSFCSCACHPKVPGVNTAPWGRALTAPGGGNG